MGKRIADSVHGTIPLSDLEVSIINTRAFQRLRNVKHLGMASYVFPGADFSRFSHSIGVCHVIGQMYDALVGNGAAIVNRSRDLYRLAGLLHDIGHYPYSHSLERPIGNHYKKSGKAGQGPLYFDHEALGEKIVLNDPELAEIWAAAGLDPSQITRLFTRTEPDDPLANLISSDIDADRLDYLPRTAIHTGLPYGKVDSEYLLSQLHLGNEGILWVDKRALRTVEHALLARYFDNQQIAFHKTVAGFELVLENLTALLLEQELLRCNAEDMLESMGTGNWYDFNDAALIRLIEEMSARTNDETVRAKISTVLLRKPPKLIADVSIIEDRQNNSSRDKIKNSYQNRGTEPAS